jgi:ribosomal 50S subunit-recycling heat shock protein
MRLDLFSNVGFARVVQLLNSFATRVLLLNGRPAKPAHAVKANDVITVRHRHRETTVRVSQSCRFATFRVEKQTH